MILCVFPLPESKEDEETFQLMESYLFNTPAGQRLGIDSIFVAKDDAPWDEHFLEPFTKVVLFGALPYSYYQNQDLHFKAQTESISRFKLALHRSFMSPFRQVFVTYNPNFQWSNNMTMTWIALAFRLEFDSGDDVWGQMHDNFYAAGVNLEDPDFSCKRTLDWMSSLQLEDSKCVALDVESNISSGLPEALTPFHPGHVVLCLSMAAFDLKTESYSTFVVETRCWEPGHYLKVLKLADSLGWSWVGTSWLFDLTAIAVAAQLFATQERAKPRPGFLPNQLPEPFVDTLKKVSTYLGRFEDTHYVMYLFDQGSKESTGLAAGAAKFLGIPDWKKSIWAPVSYIQGKGGNKPGKALKNPEFTIGDFGDFRIPLPGQEYPIPSRFDLLDYNAMDSYVTIRLWREVLSVLIEEDFSWVKEPYGVMKNLIPVLATMQYVGFPFDQSKSEELRAWAVAEVEQLNTKLTSALDDLKFLYDPKKGFNTASCPDKSNLIQFLNLLPLVPERTDTNGISTNAVVIARLADHEEYGYVFKLIQSITYARDLVSKSLDSYDKYSLNGRIHATYHPTKRTSEDGDKAGSGGTRSARLAMSDPPLHSFPGNKEPVCRAACDPGYFFICQDATSIEPVVLASISGCRAWLELFVFGKNNPGDPSGDLYNVAWAQISSRIWKPMTPAEVSKSERNQSKVVVLAYTYDRTARSLAVSLGCSLQQAEEIYAAFNEAYPELVEFSHKNRLATLAGEPPRTLLNNYQSFYTSMEPEMLDLPPMTLDQLQRTLKSGAGFDLTTLDLEELRSMGNNQIQSVATVIMYYMLIYIAHNLPPKLEIVKTVHDSIMYLHRGPIPDTTLEWLDYVGRTPKLWLPDRVIKQLKWDKYDMFRCKMTYGESRWTKDHQTYQPMPF